MHDACQWVDATRIQTGDLLVTANAANPALIYVSGPVWMVEVTDDGFIDVATEDNRYRFLDGQTVTVLRGMK